eukprot:TRINITY_DN38760_c0_g1_i2.p1 TRINITY_DN38760_c0_g1~~TRINITY_DN38760_c0_g1_i2.p1  ORF type:complete len:151 (-),score=14.73 TRINITY_DN38760_c0_g1_i2:57-509(-)
MENTNTREPRTACSLPMLMSLWSDVFSLVAAILLMTSSLGFPYESKFIKIGISISYIVVHLISIGYLVFYKKLGFRYHLKTTRIMILIPQLMLLVFTILTNYYWIANIAVIAGFVLSVITTFTILIANYCICQTAAGQKTRDIERRKGDY